MSYGSEAADQVVRMTLSGVEVAARITGKAAERLSALIYSIIKDNRRTRGKGRLNNMLKSGKELAIFTIKDRDMVKFAKAFASDEENAAAVPLAVRFVTSTYQVSPVPVVRQAHQPDEGPVVRQAHQPDMTEEGGTE